MGCAAARALAVDGHDVVLYEQYGLGHDRGSSHGRSRIFRLAYPEQEWVRLAEESVLGWRELEAECGERLLELHGLLELVADPAHGSRDALAAAGAEFELLTAEQANARWPVTAPVGWMVLHQPLAGIVRADLALRAFLDGAKRHGARVEENTRVKSVDDLDADIVVVTAGSWVTRFVPDLPVRTSRETVAYFRRSGMDGTDGADGLDGAPPAVVQLHPETRGHAMYSLRDPLHGLKAGAHHAGPGSDPDEDRGPEPELIERITEWVASTHPDVDPVPVAAQTCMYTTTADERFILRRSGRLVIGSACSGHGFKFAPAVGRRLADLAAG